MLRAWLGDGRVARPLPKRHDIPQPWKTPRGLAAARSAPQAILQLDIRYQADEGHCAFNVAVWLTVAMVVALCAGGGPRDDNPTLDMGGNAVEVGGLVGAGQVLTNLQRHDPVPAPMQIKRQGFRQLGKAHATQSRLLDPLTTIDAYPANCRIMLQKVSPVLAHTTAQV
uniref:Uncharacterized protein n=1 Tax=Haptolina ericina TaxID=156174 RepID=A0A7S3BFC1_9EUKA